MASLKDIPLRIPDKWSPTWMRTFIVEVLDKADVRSAAGVGVTVTSEGNSVATLSTDAEVSALLEAHDADPFAHVEAITAHKSEADPHPVYATVAAAQLPVGSVFLTIGNTNPSSLLGYGTWTLRASGRTLLGA